LHKTKNLLFFIIGKVSPARQSRTQEARLKSRTKHKQSQNRFFVSIPTMQDAIGNRLFHLSDIPREENGQFYREDNGPCRVYFSLDCVQYPDGSSSSFTPNQWLSMTIEKPD